MNKFLLALLGSFYFFFFVNCVRGFSQNPLIVNAPINLTTFSNLPKEIEGCGCYFYLSKTDMAKEKYICVTDYANYAFISISGKIEKLKLLSNKKDFYDYNNDKYDIKIKILKKEKDGGEGLKISGQINITHKTSQNKEIKIVGYIGC
jgi:hypothetical protein